MKTIKILLFLTFISLGSIGYAQDISPKLFSILKQDDAVKLDSLITKDNVNTCYGQYSLLSHAIRFDAHKCFDLVLEKGADVNKVCDEYVPPLMHAAEYGRLDMVKVLVAKGADINFKYQGNIKSKIGQTPITYAELYKHFDVADYLRSLKK